MCKLVSLLVERELDDVSREAVDWQNERRGGEAAVSAHPNHRADYTRAKSRSFLIGRKGLREDLKRYQEQGEPRFQRLVTEYKQHEVSPRHQSDGIKLGAFTDA